MSENIGICYHRTKERSLLSHLLMFSCLLAQLSNSFVCLEIGQGSRTPSSEFSSDCPRTFFIPPATLGLCLAHSPAHTGPGPDTHTHTSPAHAHLTAARWRHRFTPRPRTGSGSLSYGSGTLDLSHTRVSPPHGGLGSDPLGHGSKLAARLSPFPTPYSPIHSHY
jgi:hypothetical protein